MKTFFYKNIILIMITILFGIGINYTVDSYGIYGHSLNKQVLEPNKNYIKTKYVLENPKKYDSFIFGSSKVGVYSAQNLLNGKYFNMTYSQGLPNEWLDTIKIFLENRIDIKNLIIGIDSFSFTVDPKSHFQQPMRIPYSVLKKDENIFKNYLITNPINTYNIVTISNRNIRKKYYDFYFNEENRDINIDLEIDKKKLQHIVDEKFKIPTAFNEINRLEITIKEIKEIKKICMENRINLYFIINPIHETTYKYSNQEGLKELKDELAKFTDYWDFSIQNKFSSNNYYWYETSHFRVNLADLILKSIFQDNFKKNIELEALVGEFGEYVPLKTK
ncbi:MAG: hypothetical protein ACRCZ9_05250 [Fusobacteriaceae bacterium]